MHSPGPPPMQLIKMLPGRGGRFNLALFYPGSAGGGGAPRDLVVLFPGDVSDVAGDMMENKEYSLEALGGALRGHVPAEKDLVVLRPAVAPRGLYAHYTHFLGGMGHNMHCRKDPPCEAGDVTASQHLLALLGGLEKKVGRGFGALSLVGFSKGASVLTRFIERPLPELLGRVDAFCYADAGLNYPGVYPSPPAVAALRAAHPQVRVHLHGSDRQRDPARPWLMEEWEATPCDSRTVYSGSALSDHFNVILSLTL
eukprot:TRINITY_DN13634_c0_g1_i2.p2 TRINITY_DN13634_c0_g1~~TRINITY_DN13634_c0_g1_i2.p2  ORF type:complete len:255 (+),score=89.77 TRINITY_DN13634_c0_g1_i2:60-824(+)